MMLKTKLFFSFMIGCVLSAVLALACWSVLESVHVEIHPYLIVVVANMIGYLGHGVTAYIVRKYVTKK